MAGKALVFTDADRDDNGRVSVRAIDPFSGDRPPLFSTAAHDTPAAAPPVALARPLPSRRVQVAVAVAAVLILAAVWALLPRTNAPAPVRPTLPATAAPAVAASVPSAAPTAAPGCTITRAVATFYAPEGDATGDALEAGTACTLVAWHSGFADWRQISAGGAPIWVRARVLSEARTAGLPDLAPPPTATPAPLPPATARPVVIVEPPAPTQCATVRGGGAVVQRCGAAPLDQLQADAEAAWRAQMQPATTGGE